MMRVILIFVSFLLLLGFFGPEHTKYMEEREDYGDFKVVAVEKCNESAIGLLKFPESASYKDLDYMLDSLWPSNPASGIETMFVEGTMVADNGEGWRESNRYTCSFKWPEKTIDYISYSTKHSLNTPQIFTDSFIRYP